MGRVALLLFFFSIYFSPPIFGRPVPPLLRHLMLQRNDIPIITGSASNLIPQEMLEPQLRNQREKLVLNKGNLYVRLDGTGRLYKLGILNDSLTFTRVDSTFFTGDNFNSFDFTLNGNIYSYGGYGFWRNHGLIRVYDAAVREWQIIQTNREQRPGASNSVFWIDAKKGEIYSGYDWVVRDWGRGSTRRGWVNNHLFKMALADGNWTHLGELPVELAPESLLRKMAFPTPWGFLVLHDSFSYELYDLKNNVKYKAKEQSSGKLRKVINAAVIDPTVQFFYFIDSTLYFGNATDRRFDSIRLSANDFIVAGGKVYGAGLAKDRSLFMIGLLVLIALAVALIYFRKYPRKNKEVRGDGNGSELQTSGNGHQKDAFNEIEKALLRAILKKASSNESASIGEINKVLGLSEKNEAIQKKNRSEVIHSINGKWSVLYGRDAILINRKRLDFDKRSYEYFINDVYIHEVSRLLSEMIA